MLTWLLILSNFLFVGSYALLGPHALFVQSWDKLGTEFIIAGMAIFAATQIGGVWIVSFLNPKIEKSILGLLIMRLIAILLFLLPSSLCVTLSLLFYGLSHSIFYKISRTAARELILLKYPFSDRSYLLFGLTTNLAYMIFVGIGAKLLEMKNIQVLSLISILVFIASIISIYFINQEIASIRSFFLEKNTTPISNSNERSDLTDLHSKKTIIMDLVRLSGFAVPYAVMQALIPIKVLKTGYSSEYNAFLTAINSGVVLGGQILGMFIKQLNTFRSQVYDYTVIISLACLSIAYISDLPIFAITLFFWSFIEAYQIPSIEHLIFSERTYSDKVINRFLVFDSAICFLGPYLAILNTNLIFIHSSSWLTSLFNNIKF
jgi:hypothetical protein